MVAPPTHAQGFSAWRRTAALYVLLIAANVAAWLWAWRAFAGQPALLGTALLAWVFGLRHAVDADHIAAIDNVVRKLMQDGRRPIAVGFYFSLGHSTIVVMASLAIAGTTVAMRDRLEAFRAAGGLIGTSVSAVFLLLIALVNLVILRGLWSNFQQVARGGTSNAADSDALIAGGGFLARLCRPLFRSVTRSWHMYPLGFLFGLGFDTATEVGLLGIAAARAARGMSPWQTLIFPALFTAGMALVDTTDSVLMVGAYGWAFVQPLRKLWYNLTITAVSVLVALLIGGIEALGDVYKRQDLSWDEPGELAMAKYEKTQVVKAKVLDVDVEKERISLGIKQLRDDPAASVLGTVHKGDVVTCVVSAIQSNGIEVKVNDVLTGFIRRAELARDKADQRPDRFAVGEKVDAKIVSVDRAARKLTLTIKGKEVEEEKQAMAEFGSSDSGASLGDILGAAIRRRNAQQDGN